jgi:hypothetical protein
MGPFLAIGPLAEQLYFASLKFIDKLAWLADVLGVLIQLFLEDLDLTLKGVPLQLDKLRMDAGFAVPARIQVGYCVLKFLYLSLCRLVLLVIFNHLMLFILKIKCLWLEGSGLAWERGCLLI